LYSLIRVGEDTWYAPTPTNIGIFRYSGRDVCMIDAGSRDIAAGVLEQVRSHGWELKKLFLTHSHADHVAGAAFLREQTGLDPEIEWSDTGRIQLNEEVTVTLTHEIDLGLFAGFGSFPITLRADATGKSEVYWK